jgi:hypothetical protein
VCRWQGRVAAREGRLGLSRRIAALVRRNAGLLGQEQAAPGAGEEALVTLRAPAALADQELVYLGGVGGPHDVSGLVGVQAQRGDGGQVGDEAALLVTVG